MFTRAELRRIYKRNFGELARICREQKVASASLSQVLKGRAKSARLEAALQTRAKELLAKEEAVARAQEQEAVTHA